MNQEKRPEHKLAPDQITELAAWIASGLSREQLGLFSRDGRFPTGDEIIQGVEMESEKI